MQRRFAPKIHARGDAVGLDAVMELVAFSARPRSLAVALDEMPAPLASALGSEICSIYLLEGDDLVMRGNVGYAPDAIGNVRLAVGQGITGLAVESMRPISLEAAASHASYRHFPGLGEERFPIFLAVPIPGASRPLGALVLQRRSGPAFATSEIQLAVALTAPIAAIVERARLAAALAGKRGLSGAAGRRVTLSGRSIAPGQALGVVFNSPRPARKDLRGRAHRSPAELAEAIAQSASLARRALSSVERKAGPLGPTRVFASMRTILDDNRLRERVLEVAAEGRTLGDALMHVGTEAARAAKRTGEAFGMDRAQLMMEVCDSLAYLSLDSRPEPPRKAIVTCDGFSAFDVICTFGASYPGAIAVAEPVDEGPMRTLLEQLGVPVVADVQGLIRWASDGELAIVDGNHGLVGLNPKRSEVEAFRNARRSEE